MVTLDLALASRFAQAALGHVTREYPHKLDHVMSGPEDIRGPRDLHPIFYGSFDWHSCVHGYWLLARLYRRFPNLPERTRIRALFDDSFTFDKVTGERAYLDRPFSTGFERPYGWAWLLMLAAELSRHSANEGQAWAAVIRPLAHAFADRFRAFLPKQTYPIRVGTHFNTAFALVLAQEYARTCEDNDLATLIVTRACDYYSRDIDCQAWEPGGDEFLSPALMEAELMRRVLPADAFIDWFGQFLPRLRQSEPATLFTPATVSDRSDGKIAHLDGLNLSRAWCWRGLASDRRIQDMAMETAERHLQASLPYVTGDYMGEHWLASFALLAVDA